MSRVTEYKLRKNSLSKEEKRKIEAVTSYLMQASEKGIRGFPEDELYRCLTDNIMEHHLATVWFGTWIIKCIREHFGTGFTADKLLCFFGLLEGYEKSTRCDDIALGHIETNRNLFDFACEANNELEKYHAKYPELTEGECRVRIRDKYRHDIVKAVDELARFIVLVIPPEIIKTHLHDIDKYGQLTETAGMLIYKPLLQPVNGISYFTEPDPVMALSDIIKTYQYVYPCDIEIIFHKKQTDDPDDKQKNEMKCGLFANRKVITYTSDIVGTGKSLRKFREEKEFVRATDNIMPYEAQIAYSWNDTDEKQRAYIDHLNNTKFVYETDNTLNPFKIFNHVRSKFKEGNSQLK